MSLQDRSQTVITSRSKDGCRVVQKSAIFYHVSQNDTLLDIMCESGYPDYGYECGERGINLKFRIPITLIERGKKILHFQCYMLMFLENQCAYLRQTCTCICICSCLFVRCGYIYLEG